MICVEEPKFNATSYYTVAEVARRYGCNRCTVNRAIRAGTIKVKHDALTGHRLIKGTTATAYWRKRRGGVA